MIDDLPQLKYGGEFVRPERDSYSFTSPYGVRGSNIAGTFSTLSRGVVGGPFELTVTIQLQNPAMLVWWDDFYNITITEGSQRFTMELLVNGIIQEHVVQLVSNPKVSTPGWKGTVEMKLQCLPIPADRCTALARQVFQACYGDQSMCIIKSIDEVANPYLNNAWNDPLEPDTWLDFKTSLNMRKGAGVVSFARASTGTYIGTDGVLKTAGVDQPRFESGGLLIEGQSQNVFLQSQNFSTSWSLANVTVGVTGQSSPDGLNNATKINRTSGAAIHEFQQSPTNTFTTGGYMAQSVFAKAGEVGVLQIRWTGGSTGTSSAYANFDLNTGLVSGNATLAYMVKLNNGWWRCVAITLITGDGTATHDSAFGLVNSLSDGRRPTTTGTGTDGLYLFGAQLELGLFSSSYIPTTTVAVTRSQDTCWIQRDGNGNYFNPFTVSITFDTQPITSTNIGNRRGLFTGLPNSAGFEVLMVNTDSTGMFAYGNSTFCSGTKTIADYSQRNLTGVYNGSINTVYLDGETGTSTRPAVYTPGDDNGAVGQILRIGYGAGIASGRQVQGHIKSVKLWKRALTAAEVKKVVP